VSNLRQRPTALVILVLIELFGLVVAIAGSTDRAFTLAVHAWAMVEGVALVLAFAAWPVLAVRAVRRPTAQSLTRFRITVR
jgi:hypothetical protein